MSEISVTSTINLLPSKKDEVNSFAQKLVESVENGEESALDLWIKMSAIVKSFEQVKDKIKDYAISDAEKFGKSFEHIGSNVVVGATKTEYDYTACKDRQWNEFKEQETGWKAKREAREKFLKTIAVSLDIIDEGEPTTIYAPIKKTWEGLKITLL